MMDTFSQVIFNVFKELKKITLSFTLYLARYTTRLSSACGIFSVAKANPYKTWCIGIDVWEIPESGGLPYPDHGRATGLSHRDNLVIY